MPKPAPATLVSGPVAPLSDAPLPDALTGHWADTRAPRHLRPYLKLARIERPIGWEVRIGLGDDAGGVQRESGEEDSKPK